MLARVRETAEQVPGTVFAPMHWNDQFAATARVNALAHPSVDPLSGQPEFKSIPVRLAPVACDWEAAVLLRERPAALDLFYWALAAGTQHWRVFAAGTGTPAAALDRLTSLLPAGERLDFRDPSEHRFRAAIVTHGRLSAWLDVGPPGRPIEAEWVGALFAGEKISAVERRALLVGRAGVAQAQDGPIVCACHGVGRAKICRAIREQGLTDVRGIGTATAAGTGCGSCVPELRALLAETAMEAA
jgi:assimilatory nitrate reductase catalytic subunit